MSEAGISDSTKPVSPNHLPQIGDLIEDAEYVVLELARGDAVPVEVLTKAKTLINPVVKAVVPVKAKLKKQDTPTDDEVCALQTAMVNLSEAIAPVTVQSLRDTAASGGTRRGVYMFRWLNSFFGIHEDLSLADRFSDGFMAVTVAFLIAALACSVVTKQKSSSNGDSAGRPAAVAPQPPPKVGPSPGKAQGAAPAATGVTAPPTGQPNPGQPDKKGGTP